MTQKVPDNVPQPADIDNVLTNDLSSVDVNLPQYGEPTEASILALFTCRTFQQWGCTVQCTRRCANDQIRSHPRNSHAAVHTGLLLRATTEDPDEEFHIFSITESHLQKSQTDIKTF